MTTDTIDAATELKTFLTKKAANTEHISFKFSDIAFEANKLNSKNDAITIAGTEMPLTTNAFGQLVDILGVPNAFASRIPSELLNHNINYLFNSRKDNYYSALIENNIVRSFMDTTTPYVPSIDIFSAIEEAFDSDYSLKYVKAKDAKTSFSILPQSYKHSIDDSNLFGGLKVEYSDSWSIAPSFDTYIWREICSNGMIDTLKSKKFRIKGSSADEVVDQVKTFAKLSLDRLDDLFEQYQNLLEERVTDYARVIARLCSDHRLSSKVKDRILFWAIQDTFLATISNGKIENMHDIVNLFTFVGSHDLELSEEVRRVLMEIGGTVTLNHSERCGSCGTTI
jgi:hypothetical protein